jgi:hypothetical protein
MDIRDLGSAPRRIDRGIINEFSVDARKDSNA